MGRSIKSLVSDTAVYGLSSIIGRFLNYLLVPLYTYKIAAATGDYGIITNIYAYTALLLVILTFGMETTFFYFSNKEGVNPDKAFSTASISVGVVALAFVLLVNIFIGPISNNLGYTAHPEYITIMAAVVGLDAFQAILFALLRKMGRAWKFAILKLLFIIVNIGLNLFIFLLAPKLAVSHPEWMAWYNPNDLVGYVFKVNLFCTAAITLGFIPELHLLRNGVDWKLLKQMLGYAWPILLLGIAGILNQVADKICYRFIMPGQEGDVQLGIYGACIKIAMIMAMITQAFRYAYEPFVFGSGKGAKSKESQALVMKYFVIFTMLAFLAVVCYMDILQLIVDSNYREGIKAVPIVMMAEIFMGIYFNLSFWYKLIEKTWWGAIFSTVGCIVLLAVNFIFVPRIGYMACAWGGLAGYGTCMLLSYFVGQKHYKVPYSTGTILSYIFIALALYGISVVLRPEALGWRLAFNTLLLLIYAAIICWRERALVGKIFTKLLKR